MELQSKELPSKLNPISFICLKQYINKSVLSKSKILTLTNTTKMFEQRCILFTEMCYLLLRTEILQKQLYLSKNMFINAQKLPILVFSYDSKFKDKLKQVQSSNIISNIIQFYYFLFPKGCLYDIGNSELLDYQEQDIIQNNHELIRILGQIQDKNSQNKEILNFCTNDPYSVMAVLQKSQIFKEFSFPLKWNTAILIKAIINYKNEDQQVLETYKELLDIQSNFDRVLRQKFISSDLTGIHNTYHVRLFHLFKLLQSQNYLKITSIQEQFPHKSKDITPNIIIFTIDFCSNPKQLQNYSKTLKENSSSSSSPNNDEEKDNLANKKKEYMQTLNISKNEIQFRIRIQFNQKEGAFKIDVEGQSQWVIEQFYYQSFQNLWSEFINTWYNYSLENNSNFSSKESRHFKWQLVQRQKSPAIRQLFHVQPSANITKETIISIDRIIMVFLLFENILKNLYKASENMMQFEELYMNTVDNSLNVASLMDRFKEAINEYQMYEEMLNEIDRSFYQR